MQVKPPTVQFGRAAASAARRAPSWAAKPRKSSDERRWGTISWPVSIAIFAIPAVLLGATLLAPGFGKPPVTTVRVADRYTGQPIAAAQLAADGHLFTAGANGVADVVVGPSGTTLTISAPGYEAVSTTLDTKSPREWQVALRPNVLSGRLSDEETQLGIQGAEVTVLQGETENATAKTDSEGRFRVDGVPEGATIRVVSPEYGTVSEEIGQRTEIELALRPTVITGHVLDVAGSPIAGARVAAADGAVSAQTDGDGAFQLTGATGVEEVTVSAPGFANQLVAVDQSRQVSATLEREAIKAIYANLGVLSEPERWNRLIEIADTTEINAIVVDVKQDTIYYDTQVPFFRDLDGVVTPLFDPAELLAQLDEHGIYAIARMVVFKDPLVAERRPDLAVRDEVTGDLWRDQNGAAWVNAFNQELWEANAELGAELGRLGFDEVQYDYIRFPSDGDLRTADFGNDYSEAARRAAISGAVALGAEKIRGAGAHFGIDLFPIIALLGDDQGIGQTLQDLAPLADYVCLMIYPSHYALGNIPVDGHPNDFPAETVTYTLQKSEELVPGVLAKMRPWLQDFTYPMEGFSEYGPVQVRAQIDATEAFGVPGWMLWNAAGEFEVQALDPQ
jgi:hypothetical protein